MRDFAICNAFAVPVNEITGLEVNRMEARLEVHTEDRTYATSDSTEAVRFLRTLDEGSELNSASVDDMENHIKHVLT